MRTEMAVEGLLDLVERSGVIAEDRMGPVLEELRQRHPQLDSPRKVAEELVARGLLTRWQAEQLLQGKHRGFFLGPYRILDLLGSGGMGRVYLAEHQKMRRRCAIKVLPPKESKRESSVVDRFYREAQAVAALDHPNIVRAYDANQTRLGDTEVHYLVMEYIAGQDLQRMVERQGGLEYRQAADFIRQAAEGLAHAHQRGLVHRDIKPANLIVDAQGVVKILDLGLAWCFDEDPDAVAAAHEGEGVAGTADYLAPEQAVNSRNVDERADIYSLGQTFYFLLTARPPYPEGTVPERLMAHQSKAPDPIANTRPDAPPALLAVIDKMTAKQPEQRYPSAGQVAEALAAWLGEGGEGGGSGVFPARPGLGAGVMPHSFDVPTHSVRAAYDDTDLELAPLEEDERPPRKQAAEASKKPTQPAPADGGATKASDSRRAPAPAGDSQRQKPKTDTQAPSSDAPEPPAMETDLVTALEENDLMSELLDSDLEPSPPTEQAVLRPARKTPREPAFSKLLEMPAFWIGVAALVVVVLVVGIVLSVSSRHEGRPPAGDASQQAPGHRARTLPVGPPEMPAPPTDRTGPPPPPPSGKGPQKRGTTAVSPIPPSDRPGQAGPPGKGQVLVPVGSTWKWLHPSGGIDPATKDKDFHTTFSTLDYDDSHWQTGRDSPGPKGGFGYGDAVGVPFEEPAEEHRKTAYFRHQFKTRVPMEKLVLSLQRDDGVIVYLDGKEVGRDNVGSEKEAYDLFAEEVVSKEQETEVRRLQLSGSLPPGEHVLAVSLHNRPGGSSDLRIAEISLVGVPAASSR